MKPSGIVTVTTDFGLSDGYVASMKGVLLTSFPGVVIVDMTHDIGRHDIVAGAFVLASAAPHFPIGTVHVVVVDPGVGSSRAGVAIETDREWFVGPDNGVLWRAVGSRAKQITTIVEIPGFSGSRSATFHGRDVFAPAGAYLARGGEIRALGEDRADLTPLLIPEATVDGSGTVRGEVIHVDGFGNGVTNIGASLLESGCVDPILEVGGVEIRGMVRCYSDVQPGTFCALVGSDDLLEISVTEGSAAERLGLRRGSAVIFRSDRKGS